MSRSLYSFAACVALCGGTVATVRADTMVYATGYYENTLLKLNSVSGSAAPGWTAPSISRPVGVGIDGSGYVYAVAQGSNALRKYDSTGTLVSGYSVTGLNSGPQGLAIASDGTAYVSNGTSGLISVYGPSGTLITSNLLGSPIGNPYGILLDGVGSLYVAAKSTGIIYKVNATTGASNPQWTNVTGFNSPTGLALDASKNLYVSSYDGGYISKFTTTGSAVTYTSPQFAGSFLPAPQGIAIDGNDLYVALSGDPTGNQVVKYNLTTSVRDTGFTSPTFDAVGVAVFTSTPVPEIDPGSLASVLAMVFGALGAIERRLLPCRAGRA